MKIRFEVTQPGHLHLIAEHLRAGDIEEVRALSGLEPLAALSVALHNSRYARTCFVEHVPLAVFGLSNLTVLGDSAQVWCFGTHFIGRYPLSFLKASRCALAELFGHASLLTNYVELKDAPARSWLAYLGASYVGEPELRGGKLFQQFILVSNTRKATQCRRG